MRGMVGGTPTRLLAVAAALVAAALPSPAAGSQLVDRNATAVQLAVNRKGEAMITYRRAGRLKRVLVWGAVNARFPSAGSHQVRFKKDYAGGWGKYRRLYWRGFRNVCRRYDGPALAWFITGCKAPDGSYWALQSWQTPLPDLGYIPWLPMQRARELHVSHWTGPLAQLEVHTDWIYGGRFHQAISEGDGISLIVEVGAPADATRAEGDGAEAVLVYSGNEGKLAGIREATSLPIP